MEILFSDIKKEFDETFGYIRGDIANLLEKQQPLHYTVALLACCACEMLTWNRDLPATDAYKVFISFLPDEQPYKVIGKTLWEALRNGLVHNFRPKTIEIDDEEWRFSIFSQGPRMYNTSGKPHWIRLNFRDFSLRVIAQIDAYEKELMESSTARGTFSKKSKECVKPIPQEAKEIAAGLRSILGKKHH